MSASSEYATQLEGRLRALSLSPEASRWVMKAMDPVRGGPSQIPDPVQVPTLNPEYKITHVINGPGGTTNWDCCIISPPSDTMAFMFATGIPGVDFSATATTCVPIRNCGFVKSVNGAIWGMPLLNAGAFGPTWNGRAISSVEAPAAWRTAARSITVYATGSDLYNQGTVYAGQYARTPVPEVSCAYPVSAEQDIVVNLDSVSVPLDEAEMAIMTPGFYTASAREGVYSVHRLNGPTHDFVTPRSAERWKTPSGDGFVMPLYDPNVATSLTSSAVRFQRGNPLQLSPNFFPTQDYTSTGFDKGCTWGVTIFRGLHPQMSLTVKTVTTLEIIPTVEAPSRQFIKTSMKYEPTAIATYYAIASEVPTCMAAKHNFLGGIIPLLSSVAAKVMPFLAPMLSSGANALVQRYAPPPPAPPTTPRFVARSALRAPSVARSQRSSRSAASNRSKAKVKIGRRPGRRR